MLAISRPKPTWPRLFNGASCPCPRPLDSRILSLADGSFGNYILVRNYAAAREREASLTWDACADGRDRAAAFEEYSADRASGVCDLSHARCFFHKESVEGGHAKNAKQKQMQSKQKALLSTLQARKKYQTMMR